MMNWFSGKKKTETSAAPGTGHLTEGTYKEIIMPKPKPKKKIYIPEEFTQQILELQDQLDEARVNGYGIMIANYRLWKRVEHAVGIKIIKDRHYQLMAETPLVYYLEVDTE